MVSPSPAPHPADPGAVQAAHRVLGVPGVLELDEGEPWRVPGHPHVAERAVLGEGVLQLVLGRVVAKVADVDFAGDVPVAVAGGHLARAVGTKPKRGDRRGVEAKKRWPSVGRSSVPFPSPAVKRRQSKQTRQSCQLALNTNMPN